MSTILKIFILLTSITTIYSQEAKSIRLTESVINEKLTDKEKKKILEKFRKEALAEEKAKQQHLYSAKNINGEGNSNVGTGNGDENQGSLEKTAMLTEEETKNKQAGEKILEDLVLDMYTPIEDKVFASGKDSETRKMIGDIAFQSASERMAFIRDEEEEIKRIEKELGIKPAKNRIFLVDEFDKAHKAYQETGKEVDMLMLENVKLKDYYERLDKMEKMLTSGI